MPEEDYIQVELHQIRKSLIQPKTFLIVTLKEKKGPRSLAIWAKKVVASLLMPSSLPFLDDLGYRLDIWTIST